VGDELVDGCEHGQDGLAIVVSIVHVFGDGDRLTTARMKELPSKERYETPGVC
jgi:hypothetical protein